MKKKTKYFVLAISIATICAVGAFLTGCSNTDKWVGTWMPQESSSQQTENSNQSISLSASHLIDSFLGVKFEDTVGLELKDDKTFTFAILGIKMTGSWNAEGNGEYADLTIEQVDTELLSDEVKKAILETVDGKSIDNETGKTIKIKLLDDGTRITFCEDTAASSQNSFLSGSDIFSMSFVKKDTDIDKTVQNGADGMGNVLQFINGDSATNADNTNTENR